MTERENYLRVVHGELPAWVPDMGTARQAVVPGYLGDFWNHSPVVDWLNVKWLDDGAGFIQDPKRKTREFLAGWRDAITLPDPGGVDWEAVARKQLEVYNPEKVMVLNSMSTGTLFMPLVSLLGFEGALCALVEEPEECADFFDALSAMYAETLKHTIPAYRPDMVFFGDDICAGTGPFFSLDVFRKLFRPNYQKIIDVAKTYDLPVEYHLCGKCEVLMGEFVEMGIDVWQSAQCMNDLNRMKTMYGRPLVIEGGYQEAGPACAPNATEEVVRAAARKAIDDYAYGGGFIFWDGDQVGVGQDAENKIKWLRDEANRYGREFAAKHYI